MKIQPNVTGSEIDIYDSVIDQACQFAISSGVSVEHAQKMAGVLDGRRAPAKLISPHLHITNINAFLANEGLRRENASGYIIASPRSPNPNEKFAVDESIDQHFFLLAVERMGPATAQGSSRFYSYSLVLLESVGQPAVCMALDLNFDGETYSLVPSRIYRSEEWNHAARRPVATDRLAALELPTNILAFAVAAGLADGMPITDARQNRMSRTERAALNQQARYNNRPNLNVAPPSMVPAGAVSGVSFRDPFGDS